MSRSVNRCWWYVLATLGVVESACEGDYPIAPTACDDWCLATQRGDCADDHPQGCVVDCENEALGRRVPRCEPEWRQVIDCYMGASKTGFFCQEEESRPPEGVCDAERVALGHCASRLAGLCIERCIRNAHACGESSFRCEADCPVSVDRCEAEWIADHECALSVPTQCEDQAEEDLPPEEIPCARVIYEVLGCEGF